MADYVDVQYATLLASRFNRYRIVHQNPLKINFRCPVCGDSKKSKTKARCWIVEMPKNGHLHTNCFNCGYSESFRKFAKQIDPNLYNDYITERYLDKARGDTTTHTDERAKTETPKFKESPLRLVKKISQLKSTHPAKKYIENRRIPSNKHHCIYYAPKFMQWINTIVPGKFDEATLKNDEPRLILPLLDKDKRVFGVSARSFNPKSSLRYITIMFADMPKIFGLDTIDFNKTYFVTEGVIDALFLNNSVAMVGADANFDGLKNFEKAIFIHDKEPRNKEICDRMEKLLNKGYKICIWPSNVPGKDINEMHLRGVKNIEEIILENTYGGLLGQLKMKEWRKC